jgi:hypothetical protein
LREQGTDDKFMPNSVGFPWWVSLSLALYFTAALGEMYFVVRYSKTISSALWVIPTFLVKAAAFLFAYANWNDTLCTLVTLNFGTGTFLYVAAFSMMIALRNLSFSLVTKPFPKDLDDLMLIVQIILFVLLPALVLYFAYSALVDHRCLGLAS